MADIEKAESGPRRVLLGQKKAQMDKLTRHHLMNLANGKAVPNKDGTISTIRTMTFETQKGVVVIPTVWDGKILKPQIALQRAMDAKVFEIFPNEAAAQKFDKGIHRKNPFLNNGAMKPLSAAEARAFLDQKQDALRNKK